MITKLTKKQVWLLVAVLLGLLAPFWNYSVGHTLSGGDFKAGNIISDGLFTNVHTMDSNTIQQFLNSKVPTCDTDGQKQYSSNMTRAQYGASKGYYAPYTCLKSYSQNTPTTTDSAGLCSTYYGGNKTAAQIINDVAKSCGINPQALIVLLQKEQALITDEWPWSIQYRSATGYGCPDTAACDSDYYGFFNQVYNAAKAFKRYANNPSAYNYRAGRDNTILYNPNHVCGSSTVNIQTQATAGLYIYTPYQPNQAALNNLYGSGDSCSAYGNRNFWRLFNDWFGNTNGNQYEWQQESIAVYSNSSKTEALDTRHLKPGSRVFMSLGVRNTGWSAWVNYGSTPTRIGASQPNERQSQLCDGSWISCSRPAQLKNELVYPGQSGLIEFWINIPRAPGQHTEYFNMLAENHSWMKGPDLNFTYNVDVTYEWYPVSSTTYLDNSKAHVVDMHKLTTNSRFYRVLTVKNTGNATWTNTGNTPVIIAPNTPNERQSDFCDATWINCRRITKMKEASVAPGENATFEYWIKTPSGQGRYYDRYNLVAENASWFKNLGTYHDIVTYKPLYDWSPVSSKILDSSGNEVTSHFRPATKYSSVVTVKNTGNTYWRKGIINMATVDPRDRTSKLYSSSWISQSRAATLTEAVVAPGETGTFRFDITTPTNNWSILNEQFGLVAETVTWMPPKGLTINMDVGSADYVWEYVGHWQYTDATGAVKADMNNLVPSKSYFFTIKARNVGSEPWHKGQTIIGTTQPRDRVSAFRHSTWISDNRTGVLFEDTVKPGAIGTFGFWIKTPSAPGTYSEGFGALQEHVSWFNELGITFNARVR